MTYTRHGHHIPGTPTDDEEPNVPKMRCGGPTLCTVCSSASLAVANSAPPVPTVKVFLNVGQDHWPVGEATYDDRTGLVIKFAPGGDGAETVRILKEFSVVGISLSMEYFDPGPVIPMQTLTSCEICGVSQDACDEFKARGWDPCCTSCRERGDCTNHREREVPL